MLLKCIDTIEVEIIENEEFDFLMDTSNVAKGYGTNEANIRNAKRNNPEELIEGKHYFTDKSKGKKMFWTKKGIVRLGFFIKSESAKKFRDWAEDYIVNENLSTIKTNVYQISGYKSQIAQHNKKIYQLEDRITSLSSELEKAKINNINNHSDNIIKLIDKGLKYDKLNNEFCELCSKHTEIKSAMKKITDTVDIFRPKRTQLKLI